MKEETPDPSYEDAEEESAGKLTPPTADGADNNNGQESRPASTSAKGEQRAGVFFSWLGMVA